MRNNCEDDLYPEDEYELIYKIQRDSCKTGLLKIENDNLVCVKCDHIFIDKPNVTRINKFDGGKVARLLGPYRNPYKDHYHNRNGECDFYFKLFPNPNLEPNLNVIWEFFGDKMFLILLEDFGELDDLLDEKSVNAYLFVLFKALKKGAQAFTSLTMMVVNEVLGRLLKYVLLKLEWVKDFSEQEDFILKSILSFFVLIKNLDMSYIDTTIEAYFFGNKHIVTVDLNWVNNYTQEIERYSHNLKHANQEIKEFLEWLRKKIMANPEYYRWF